MIEYLRQKTKSKFSMFIMGLIAVSFGLFGIQNYLIAGARSNSVAVVDGKKIRSDEVARKQQEIINQIITKTGKKPDAALLKQIETQAIYRLVVDKAKVNAAKKMGFYADRSMVSAAILEDAVFKVNDAFSKERYNAILNAMRISEQGFFNTVLDTIVIEQLHQAIAGTAFVLPNETTRAGAHLYEQRKIGTITIANRAVAKQTVAQQEIEEYYNSHKSEYMLPLKYKLDYIVMDRVAVNKNASVSNQEIADYYNNNLQQFIQPERVNLIKWQVGSDQASLEQLTKLLGTKNIAREIKKQFNNAAKQELGWLTIAQAQKLDANISKLRAGQWTKPKQQNGNWVIYQYIKHQPASKKTLAQAKQAIVKQIKQDKGQQEYSLLSERLVDQAYAEDTSLDETARILKLTKHTSTWLGEQGASTGILSHPSIQKAALSAAVIKERQNSGLIPLEGGKAVVIRIAEFQPAVQQPLSSVSNKIKSAIHMAKLSEAKQVYADKLVKELNGTAAITKLISSKGLSWHNQPQYLSRGPDKSNISRAAIEQAFSLQVTDDKVHAAVVKGNKENIQVVVVITVKPGTIPAKTLGAFNKQLSSQYANIDLIAASEAVVKQAKIELANKR